MKRRDQRGRLKEAGFIILVIVSLMIPGIASAGEFILIDKLETLTAMSGDGQTLAGRNPYKEGCTWTQAGELTYIEGLHGHKSTPQGVSNNGTVVGTSLNGYAYSEAFIYDPATGSTTGLGTLAGGTQKVSAAYAISNDGTVVVGKSDSANGVEAFIWTADGGMVGLGDLEGGGFSSSAHAVSGDGSVVAGLGYNADNNSEAFVWTEGTGMEGLGYIGDYNGTFYSSAEGVSADGSTVVGVSSVDGGFEAFLWTEEDGMIGLGDLEGGDLDSHSFANDVSGDGSIVVGFSETDVGQEAFIWTEDLGMLNLADYLELLGLDLYGMTLKTAKSISDDGLTIAGYCSDGSAYIVNLDSLPCTPAPIPGAVWLLGSGLVGLVGMRRRSRRH